MRSNPEFCGKRPATDRRSHGKAFEDLNISELYTKIQSVYVIKTSQLMSFGEMLLFVLRSVQYTQIHCVGRT